VILKIQTNKTRIRKTTPEAVTRRFIARFWTLWSRYFARCLFDIDSS